MTDEDLIISIVQAWAAELFPDNRYIGRRAAAVALSAYVGGASLIEACQEGRFFLVGRARHPAGRGGFRPGPLTRAA